VLISAIRGQKKYHRLSRFIRFFNSC